jgi:hypothetical protein
MYLYCKLFERELRSRFNRFDPRAVVNSNNGKFVEWMRKGKTR